MPRIKLTDRTLKALSTQKETEEYVDDDFRQGEFGVRISNLGRKSFFLRYRVNGKRRRLPLGTYPSISLADARAKALENVAGVHEGKDPAKVRKEARKAGTVEDLFDTFMEQKERTLVHSTMLNYRSMWNRDCKPTLADMKAADVQKAHIIELLDRIEARCRGPHMVNRTRSMLMSLFNWALAKDRCKHNPVFGVPRAQKRELPGERFLSRSEIRIYWECSGEMNPTDCAFWRLLILLALRPGEVMKLRWDWIDDYVLTLPGSAVKNKREHRLYLTDVAREEIGRLKTYSGSSEFVFPGIGKDKARMDFTDSHAILLKNMGVAHWTPRDIRRTCETQMRTFIRDSEGISRVLNHDMTTIRKHYDKGDYFDRKREVLILWSKWLMETVTSEQNKVVNLRDYSVKSIPNMENRISTH